MLIVTFHNDGTGDQTTASYDIRVTVNEWKLLYTGKVENHTRGDFRDLIIDLAEQFKLEQHKENQNV
jgi:hypothetical protein